jgi:hypothetical protein
VRTTSLVIGGDKDMAVVCSLHLACLTLCVLGVKVEGGGIKVLMVKVGVRKEIIVTAEATKR